MKHELKIFGLSLGNTILIPISLYFLHTIDEPFLIKSGLKSKHFFKVGNHQQLKRIILYCGEHTNSKRTTKKKACMQGC